MALRPGAIIGILGGGQLGRMSAMAAARLGYRAWIYSPSPDGPGAQVSWRETAAGWDDRDALERFADGVDRITIEWENVPAEVLHHMAQRRPLHPSPRIVTLCQDRLTEKRFLQREAGAEVAPFEPVDNLDDLRRALERLGRPARLKTRRLGYDGRGQAVLDEGDDPEEAWQSLGCVPAILEAQVPFTRELSIIVARNEHGELRCFPVAENHHESGILRRSTAPAKLRAGQHERIAALAKQIAVACDLVGVLAVELFDGPGDALRVNELAPRPHNSGHWSIEACQTSQFEQHIRAVCGLPLGATDLLAPAATMENLLGDEIDQAPQLLAEPGAHLHLYGKDEARPGRKMGHVTRLSRRPG